MRSLARIGLVVFGIAGAAAACSAAGNNGTRGGSGAGQTGTGTGTGNGSGNGGAGSTSSGGMGGIMLNGPVGSGPGTGTGMGTGGGIPCTVTDMNADMDMDGWTPAQGDCNDCDPNVNPGAVDVPGSTVDSDCDGMVDPPQPCDTGLALDDVSPGDAAKAIELCRTTTESATGQQKTWGVLSAAYVKADGTAFPSPGAQVGIQSGWGPNVHVQGGQNMLALSSGYARTPSQPNACGSNTCAVTGQGNPPPNFPQATPGCGSVSDINDDIGFEVKIRTPTNATGYSFSFKFYSMEFPFFVCNMYNDQFIALVTPAPSGSINGNISFDSKSNPVSVNLGFFDVCDPTQQNLYGASACNPFIGGCPTPPNPYCPSGTAQLQGTGFDVWDKHYGGAGATSWLKSQAPVTGGEEITIRFAMWDAGDQAFDSTTLIDDFQWIATPGTSVTVGTTPIPTPK